MNQKHFKILLVLLVAAFIIPQITLAAWWNPASWGMWNSIFHFQKQVKNLIIGNEKACTSSGGKISTQDCYCLGAKDFRNNCLIGGCSCPPNPQFKKQVKDCDCGEGKCWDGVTCVGLNKVLSIESSTLTPECRVDLDCPQPNCSALANCIGMINKCVNGKCELTKTENQTAGWKTYTNTEYGFEFKYPQDFIISINPQGSTVIFRLVDNNMAVCDMYIGPIYSRVSDLLAPPSSTQKKIVTDITISGIKAKRIREEERGLDAGLITTYAGYASRNNIHYLFSCVPVDYKDDGFVFDKMLSTFKFTK